MGVPGPGVGGWALALLAWAALAAIVGELVRTLTARFVSLWRHPEPIERGLLDFFLGGGLLYLVAATPWDAFVAPVVYYLPVAAAAGLMLIVIRASRRPGWTEELLASFAPLRRPVYLVAILSALGLFVVELSVATPIGTGNTYDSSLLTLYTSLLLQHHTTPLSFAPYASTGILYPQGTTAWLAWAQITLGPPPARTALLVTPLFFGLAPLGGFVFGRRLIGTDRAGLAVALLLAWVGPGTRGVVYGSNDFVLAFPLVLLLAGQAVVWLRSPLPRFSDAFAFGLLAGYSAAINPVGAEWLLLALPIAAFLTQPRFGGFVRGWLVRWGVAVGATLVGVIPSIYVLALGRSSPGFVPGATSALPGRPTGIDSSQFVGAIDPFLFGSSDTGLSPLAALRLELAILIVVGLVLLVLVRRDSALGRYLDTFRTFALGAGVVMIGLLAVVWGASSGFGPAVTIAHLTSAAELSIWLFTLYGLVAAVPLVLALERFAGWVRRTAPPVEKGPRGPTARWSLNGSPSLMRAVIPMAVVLVLVVPGVVLTPTQLPPALSEIYNDFGNVSGADFDLLLYAGSVLPAGARVLVAPGSAGEFLPGYCTNIVLLYPMVPGFRTVNTSYQLLVRDLPNGTLDSADTQALVALDVQYVVVTGNNSNLWRAFSPAPFLAMPETYALLFHEGDAYLFASFE
ncbi:MAG: hypothetical protein WB788_01590 [Thermoplasmata archaeon]|nr:hypothetical protein [Thermoplasmata archaeon]